MSWRSMLQIGTAALLAGVLGASRATAQSGVVDPRCAALAPSQLVTEDACQKAVDLFRFMAPQLGVVVVGGNPVLGLSGALGGLGHVSIGVRANAISGRLPRASQVSLGQDGAVSSEYAVEGQSIGLPVFDAAIGLFSGIELPGSRALAFDALVNVGWIPRRSEGEIDVSLPGGALHVGYGGRLVLLEESIVTPGITATFLRRRLPTLELLTRPGEDLLNFRDVSVHADQWRVLFAKHFGGWELSAGGGQDRYRSSTEIRIHVLRGGATNVAGPIVVEQALTRDNGFVGVATTVAPLRVGFEVGRVEGGSIQTFNSFGGRRADAALTYVTLGARLSW